MARLITTGWETGSATELGPVVTGAPVIESTIKRSGAYSLKCPSGANSYQLTGAVTAGRLYFFRFYLYLTANPSANVVFANIASVSVIGLNGAILRLNTDGTVVLLVASSTVRSTSAALNLNAWNLIELSGSNSNVTPLTTGQMKINGVDSGSFSNVSGGTNQFIFIGCGGTGTDLYFDDLVLNDDQGAADNTFAGPAGTVILLKPTADSAVGTGWTDDNAATSNLFNSIDNIPPAGIADTVAGGGGHQVRNATSNANVNYDATMQTYTVAGIPTGATINEVTPIILTAAPVATSAKSGTIEVVSNPAIANVALGAGTAAGTAGQFWGGAAAGTYPVGWKYSNGTPAHSPAVTLGIAPVMRITQVTSSTRIAVCCFMGIYVDYTLAGPRKSLPPSAKTARNVLLRR